LSLGAEYYHKRRDNDYDHSVDYSQRHRQRQPFRLLRAQRYTTDDVNFRDLSPRGNLSLVGRYDMQRPLTRSRTTSRGPDLRH
jgi:hypothetical protein